MEIKGVNALRIFIVGALSDPSRERLGYLNSFRSRKRLGFMNSFRNRERLGYGISFHNPDVHVRGIKTSEKPEGVYALLKFGF